MSNALKYVGLALGCGLLLSIPAEAASSTRSGEISVLQVMELAQGAASNDSIRQALMAYLAGTGETTGILTAEAMKRQPALIACNSAISVNFNAAVAALAKAAPDKKKWQQTPATPILVEDMLSRAGCH